MCKLAFSPQIHGNSYSTVGTVMLQTVKGYLFVAIAFAIVTSLTDGYQLGFSEILFYQANVVDLPNLPNWP